MTALLVWVVMSRSHLPRDVYSNLVQRLVQAVVLNAIISFIPGISLEGHFGGGIAGAIAAFFLYSHRFGFGVRRWLCLVAVAAMPFASVSAVVWAQEHSLKWRIVALQLKNPPAVPLPAADDE
jgi:rhomboid protease GluP